MKIRFIRNPSSRSVNPCVATIGNFDGLHIGHQQLIAKLVAHAKQYGLLATVITFEPMPQMVLRSDALLRLMSFRQKCELLKEWGVEQVVCLRFNKQFSLLSPQAFVETILVDTLAVKHLLVGEDFRFGYQQQGDVKLLQQMGNTKAFSVATLQILQHQTQKISSTRVRELLLSGDLVAVKAKLGRNYQIAGRVVVGSKLARGLGFPTANLKLKPANVAFKGVFITNVYSDGKRFNAVTNVGMRPTLDGKNYFLEAHILDFTDMLYGKHIKVEFLKKIREEKRFNDIQSLQKQIEQDVNMARDYFKSNQYEN